MLRGNKGEWSEVYVLLKLLVDGKLHAADQDLHKIENIFYPILKIIRKELNCYAVEKDQSVSARTMSTNAYFFAAR